MAFNLTIHMVSSLDGIIARKDNSVGWFETTSHYEQGVDAEHAAGDEPAIDCFVMGSKTFELAVTLSAEYGWPYGDIPVVVLSRRKLPVERDNVEIYAGDLQTLVSEHLAPRYKNVWLVGGAEVAADFIRQKLANDIRLTIIPIVLGEGKPFLSGEGLEQALQLKKVTAHKTGLVELWYTI